MNIADIKTYINKALIFYSPDKAAYWNSITRCSISDKPSKLDRYYLDFSSKANYPGLFSKEGIPLYSYRGLPHIEHPIVIAQYALGLYEILFSSNFKDKILITKFLKIAQWFEMNNVCVKGGKGWYIKTKYPEYNLNSPWISAMAQGEAISVLSRASILTKNYTFEQLANEAIRPFELEVKDGGLINYFNSIPIYEEFPTPKKTMAVLNGFLFSLFGIYDLYLLNENKKAKNLFVKGIDSLKKILPYFDLGNWSRYYLFDYPNKYYSSFTYHILVVEQLKAMFYLTGDKYFWEISEKWDDYANSFFKKNKALLNKIIYANKLSPYLLKKLWKSPKS